MITYRVANAFDLPVFVSLDKDLFPYSPWSASQYKEEFSSPTRYFVVALNEQQSIIGYAGVFAPGQAEADVLTVGVVPEYRGKGIAKALMALLTDWANAQGSTAMMLEVKTDNYEALGLYESLGFLKLNVRKDYFGTGLDAQVMRLELS
jgi:ribosomal-protein-alanine N-acetyltransferase